MAAPADCAALSSAINVNLGADCCTTPLAQCAGGRITILNAMCGASNWPWFNGFFPLGLEALTGLNVMFFDNCNMTGALPDIWNNFPGLFELHLQGNSLQGPLPPSMGSMTSMQYFHLQSNSFIGSIPASWTGMTSLQVVQIDGNCLTGTSGSPNPRIKWTSQGTNCPSTPTPRIIATTAPPPTVQAQLLSQNDKSNSDNSTSGAPTITMIPPPPQKTGFAAPTMPQKSNQGAPSNAGSAPTDSSSGSVSVFASSISALAVFALIA